MLAFFDLLVSCSDFVRGTILDPHLSMTIQVVMCFPHCCFQKKMFVKYSFRLLVTVFLFLPSAGCWNRNLSVCRTHDLLLKCKKHALGLLICFCRCRLVAWIVVVRTVAFASVANLVKSSLCICAGALQRDGGAFAEGREEEKKGRRT